MSAGNNAADNDACAFHNPDLAAFRTGVQHFRPVAWARDLGDIGNMTRALVDQICAACPGAVAADPTTELDSWKVGGKMFATFGERINGVCVKTDSIETATMLIDAGAATKAPYFHRSWVLISLDADAAEIAHRVGVSYDIIRNGLPRAVRSALPPVQT